MANIKHSAPTLTINEVKGWNTRQLYNYYGRYDNTLMEYVDEAGGYTSNLFAIINTYQGGVGYPIQKGIYSFPSKYFVTGKSVKIEGQFLVTSGGSRIFNIYAQINNSNNGIIPIAATNNFNNHNFANTDAKTDVPVYFKIVYTAVEDNAPQLSIMANGHYMYERAEYNSTGTDTRVVYVPIWDSTPYNVIDDTTGTNDLYISFDGSDVEDIKLVYMTVEELS